MDNQEDKRDDRSDVSSVPERTQEESTSEEHRPAESGSPEQESRRDEEHTPTDSGVAKQHSISPTRDDSLSSRVTNFKMYGRPKRESKDASTNTPILPHGESIFNLSEKEQSSDPCGVIWCHSKVLESLPVVRKVLFCIPLRYGVYSILSGELIFFCLRGYTRVLHLAMPEYYHQPREWMASTELLLCLLVLAANVFLLFGIFFNPVYILVWIDIHFFQMAAYATLTIWLAAINSECVLECPLLFAAYIIGFFYFIVAVNSFRRSWELPNPSDTSIEVRNYV